MFTPCISLFLTLVLIGSVIEQAHAAKPTPSPDFDDSASASSSSKQDPRLSDPTIDLIDISPPPPGQHVDPAKKREYFYSYRRALTLRVGQIQSSVTNNGTKTPQFLGIQFMYTSLERDTYEGAADLLSDGAGVLQFGKRYFFLTGKFRPYATAGGRILVNPADGMALFVNFANFQAAGAAGLEYLLFGAQSIRLHAELAIGTKVMHVITSAGYVWAW